MVNAFADGKSVGGKFDGRLQQFLERQCSRALEQRVPCIDGAGNDDRVNALLRHFLGVAAQR